MDCSVDDNLKNYFSVNEQLKKISKSEPMVCFVSAEGLKSNSDNLHFNAEALYEFGIRYFDEFEKKRNSQKVFVEKRDMDCALRTDMELL